MDKNFVIGGLVVIVLGGLGYYFLKSDDVVPPVENTPASVTNITNITPASATPTVPSSTSPKPDAPIVQTDKNNSVSSSTAALSGNVNPNGASTTYWFDYGETSAFGTQSASQAIGSGYYSTPTPAFISGLHANTLYYYRLSAKNKFATVNGSMYTFQTNSATPPRVAATTVHTLAASSVDRTNAIIRGEVNPNGSATSYWFEYGTDNDFGNSTQVQATNSGTSYMPVSVSLSGLSPSTKYYFRLNAQNQFGTVNGSVMNFTTSGPAASSKPVVDTTKAINVDTKNATFTGRVQPSGASTTYWFEYSNDSLLNNLINSGTPEGTIVGTIDSQNVQITMNSLQPNTKYYYHLVAKNENGTTTGNIVSFTTKK